MTQAALCRALRVASATLVALGIGACAPSSDFSCVNECAVDFFFNRTAIVVQPGVADVVAGESVTAQITLIRPVRDPRLTYEDPSAQSTEYSLDFLQLVEADEPGFRSTITLGADARCDPLVVPQDIYERETDYICTPAVLKFETATTATRSVPVRLVAQWKLSTYNAHGANLLREEPVQRLGDFAMRFVTPDFQLAVGAATGGVYATAGTLPVSITRIRGFAEAVTLDFNGLASGITGSFAAQATPTDSRELQLQIPARHAGGGSVDLRLTATAAGGLTKVVNFSLSIQPLFRVSVRPAAASLTTASALSVDVSVAPGVPFHSTSLGQVDLTLSQLPEGVTAMFLVDAAPIAPILPAVSVTRMLRLVTNGSKGFEPGPLTIRGTARGLPPDINGVVPFVETTLTLTVVEGFAWQFVGNNLTYGTQEANTIGMALQSDNRPALAWIEGTNRRVFMRRYDGTTFAPSPPRVADQFGALYEPALSVAGGILEASFALSATDAGHVAFTYDSGARLAVGRADRAGVDWSIAVPIVVGDAADPATPRARSPRVAIGTADPVVVSYIREANAATTTGGVLQVLRSSSSGILSPLPTSLPGGSLNASPVGSVVRHATALALRADGNPWVAWIEQPTDMMLPARLWLRAYDGNDWGPVIAVTTNTPLGTSVQLLVEPSGTVVVAWVVGSTAQLKLARYDPSSQFWTPLDNTGNASGSLNVTASFPALDVHLAREPGSQGRLLVTWTEGGADPRVWIKRQNADGSWAQLGTTVSQVDRWSKTPRIVSDTNNLLYVAWATYAAGQNPGTALPYAEIDVAQWIFP